jgi:hypothetical protein
MNGYTMQAIASHRIDEAARRARYAHHHRVVAGAARRQWRVRWQVPAIFQVAVKEAR